MFQNKGRAAWRRANQSAETHSLLVAMTHPEQPLFIRFDRQGRGRGSSGSQRLPSVSSHHVHKCILLCKHSIGLRIVLHRSFGVTQKVADTFLCKMLLSLNNHIGVCTSICSDFQLKMHPSVKIYCQGTIIHTKSHL